MTKSTSGLRLFISGERVEPGVYRDIETGATVRVCEPDTLPARIRIVRDQRLFMRIEESIAETSEDRATAVRPRALVEVA